MRTILIRFDIVRIYLLYSWLFNLNIIEEGETEINYENPFYENRKNRQ